MVSILFSACGPSPKLLITTFSPHHIWSSYRALCDLAAPCLSHIMLFHLLPCSESSGHTDPSSCPWTHLACLHRGAFPLAVPYAWNALPAFPYGQLFFSRSGLSSDVPSSELPSPAIHHKEAPSHSLSQHLLVFTIALRTTWLLGSVFYCLSSAPTRDIAYLV